MNKFNDVFLSIKKHCTNQKHIAEIDFETICKETHIPVDQLPMYLKQLKESGLINYSMEDRYIHLTPFGKKQEKLVKG